MSERKDIVDRLRNALGDNFDDYDEYILRLRDEAATEIERLRAIVERLPKTPYGIRCEYGNLWVVWGETIEDGETVVYETLHYHMAEQVRDALRAAWLAGWRARDEQARKDTDK